MSRWVTLIYKVPREPSATRVYVWRKLKRLGAVSLQDAVWVLPETPRTKEQFQWLAAEISELGGEVTFWASELLFATSEEALIEQFTDQVDAGYKEVLALLKRKNADLAALSLRYQQLLSQDYFQSRLGERVRKAGAADRKRRQATMKWVTWEHVGVDRIGCAWLIRRDIDPKAEFMFIPPSQKTLPAGAEPFDIPGVKLSHHGGHCSFHAIVKAHRLDDPILARIARIIDEADTVQEVCLEPAAAGLDLICEGIRLVCLDDATAIERGAIVYDALYERLKSVGDGNREA